MMLTRSDYANEFYYFLEPFILFYFGTRRVLVASYFIFSVVYVHLDAAIMMIMDYVGDVSAAKFRLILAG